MSQSSEGNPPLRLRLTRRQWEVTRRESAAAGVSPTVWARRRIFAGLGEEDLGEAARPGRPPRLTADNDPCPLCRGAGCRHCAAWEASRATRQLGADTVARMGGYHRIRRTDPSGLVSWYHCPTPEAEPTWAAVGTPMPPTLAEAVLVLERRRWPGCVVEMVAEDSGRDPRGGGE